MQLMDLSCLASRDACMEREVMRGLSARPKKLPPKLLYDERGSQLFEEICALEEYYVTRTELRVLRDASPEIAAALGAGCFLFEFGSGASRKVRLLLDALERPAAYAPIDISREMLESSARLIAQDYPRLEVIPIVADFTRGIPLSEMALPRGEARAVFFPGSTIGNFDPLEAREFLAGTGRLLRRGGLAIIGVDLVKDKSVLEAAYDDARGVTAEFNLNLLDRINRELGADFRRDRFRHRALFNMARHRVEMHLESVCAQRVTIKGRTFEFNQGETIHTESSYKFTAESFGILAASAGFLQRRLWTDERGWFGVFLLECVAVHECI